MSESTTTRWRHARCALLGRSRMLPAGTWSSTRRAIASQACGQRLLAHELAHVVQQQRAASVVRRQTAQPAPTGLPDKTSSGMASRDEVVEALTTFLTKVQTEGGTYSVHVTAPVRQALEMLAESNFQARLEIDLFLSRANLPPTPEALAREAATHLPLAIPLESLRRLNRMAAVDPKGTKPATIGTSVGAIFDATIAPLIKALPVSEELRAKIAAAARTAIGDGLVGLVDAAMSNSPIDDKAKAAIHVAIQAAIKQPPAAQKLEPTSPYVPPPPLSAALRRPLLRAGRSVCPPRRTFLINSLRRSTSLDRVGQSPRRPHLRLLESWSRQSRASTGMRWSPRKPAARPTQRNSPTRNCRPRHRGRIGKRPESQAVHRGGDSQRGFSQHSEHASAF